MPAAPTPSSAFGPLQSWLHSTELHLTLEALALAALVLWLAITLRVHRDARRRIERGPLVALATLLGLVPLVGPLLWLLVRPPEPTLEVMQRELEMRAFAAALERRAAARCPSCAAEVEPAFVVCPVCSARLKHPCSGCGAPVAPGWQACPHCETRLDAPAAAAASA